MDFEEFFKKKRIDLVALEKGEPALFSEFKIHYERMGEKSFDHTKKYWFNKLRLRFHTLPEVKVEKVTIENPLAEQTITESLIESSSQTPSIGFKPKFRAGVTKPAEEAPQPKEEPASPPHEVGFKPRFKAGVTKPSEETTNTERTQVPEKTTENTEQTPSSNIGFKPRFKAGVTKPAEPAANVEPAPEPEKPAESEKPASAPVGFKPRFNMKNIKPKEEE